MEILITGAEGLVGFAVFKQSSDYLTAPSRVVGFSKEGLDVTNFNQCEEEIKKVNPDIVIHCAAYTNVDKAEEEREKVFAVNHKGTRNIAKICADINIPIVYISTDAVFDGETVFAYTVEDKPNPKSSYGFSKYLGEVAVLHNCKKYYILRTNWVYGEGRTNFITSALNKLIESPSDIVEFTTINQLSSPTYVGDLVRAIFKLIYTGKYGTYHYTNRGYVHREDVIKFMGEQLLGKHIKVDEYQGVTAFRPKRCGLDSSLYEKITGDVPPHWKDSLRKYVEKTIGEKI